MLLVSGLEGAYPCSALSAGPETPCGSAAQEKWQWRSPYEDSVPPFWDMPAALTEVSPASCLSCYLWAEDALPLAEASLEEAARLNRAWCMQALGMKDEALKQYRRLLAQASDDKTFSTCLTSTLEILYNDNNFDAAIEQFRSLSPALRDQVSPEGLYLVAQSLYAKQLDSEADTLLQRISKDSDFYAYALYEQAQLAFRKGEMEKAAMLLKSVADLPPDNPAPEMIRDIALLSRARLLYQTGRYEESIEGFRALSRSRLYLADALMGTGWCYQALGQPAKAISYFGAVENAPFAGTDAWALSSLEMANLYSRSGLQEQALDLFGKVQKRLEDLVIRYRNAAQDPVELGKMANYLVAAAPAVRPPRDQAPVSPAISEETEMFLFFDRERHTSARLKTLLAFAQRLLDLQSQVDRLGTQEPAAKTSESPYLYPPFTPSTPALDPLTVELLEASLSLLDTELRLDEAGGLLELVTPEQRRAQQEARTAFYAGAFQSVLLAGPVEQDPLATLVRMQTMVRNLPLSLEVRERILNKILSLKRAMEEARRNLQNWQDRLEAGPARAEQTARLLQLREWLALVRTLVLLRSWEHQPPAFCLLDVLGADQDTTDAVERQQTMKAGLLDRIGAEQMRLRSLVQEEVGKMNQRRVSTFDTLLTKSQMYYAEGLLHRQQELLDYIQADSLKNPAP